MGQFQGGNSISDFLRFKKGSDGGGELQSAIVSYKKRFPWSLLNPFLQVDLVSTVHIGDKVYFETLQKQLAPFDCVLYEMVTSRENLKNGRIITATKKRKRSWGFNIFSGIQRQMAGMLMLDFQLDCLDYQAENWVHADLDSETFDLLQDERGENFFTYASDVTLKSTKGMVQSTSARDDPNPWRSKLLWASRTLPMPLVGLLIIGGVCADGESEELDYSELKALSRLDLVSAVKVFLAKALTSEFIQYTVDEEEDDSVIIGERNRVAIEELQRAIDEGHKKIAILYGGGHMPDLGRRLKDEFELIPFHVQWITAWSMKTRELETSSLPFLKTMAEVSGWPLNRYQTLALLIGCSVLAADLWIWGSFIGSAVNWVSEIASGVFQYVDNLQ